MANKHDPFDWVQNTKGKIKRPKSAKKSPAKPRKPKAAPEPTPERFIFVKYDTNDGRIVATHKIHRQAEESTDNPWKSLPEGRAAAQVGLIGELADKEPSDIHMNYKVVISKKKLKLVPKG